MLEDCFFITREDSEGILRICPLCLACGQKYENSFYWDGSKSGYGNTIYQCGDCKKEIHRPKNMEAT